MIMKEINVFIGGGVKLLHGDNMDLTGYREEVIAPVFTQVNSQEFARHFFKAIDYSDLAKNVVKGRQQEVVYNDFIRRKAHVSLFIIDGTMGPRTKEEIDVAVTSTRKSKHPLVYIYGTNIAENSELTSYANQKEIDYQHYKDKRDLADKIKTDLTIAVKKIERRCNFHCLMWLMLTALSIGGLYGIFQNKVAQSAKIEEACTAQLYLMRYKDVNVLTDVNMFNDSLLDKFKYEDSIVAENDRAVYPIYVDDSCVVSTQPYFRLKLHNKHRNTVVFVEAVLEVDQYSKDTLANQVVQFSHSYTDVSAVDNIAINPDANEYLLGGFRQNVAYGETDDRYFFTLNANENCSFRMRVKAKTHLGDYLYSNYVYVNYIK